jgi:hypothetical protein
VAVVGAVAGARTSVPGGVAQPPINITANNVSASVFAEVIV